MPPQHRAGEQSGVGPAPLFGSGTSIRGDEDRTAAYWIPKSNHAALSERYAREPVWKEAILPEGDKLLEPVDALLAGRVPAKARRYSLTDPARALVSEAKLDPESMPGSERPYHELVALLRPRAAERISAVLGPSTLYGLELPGANSTSCALRLAIHDVTLYRFGTGVAVAVAEVEGRGLTGMLLAPWNARNLSYRLVTPTSLDGALCEVPERLLSRPASPLASHRSYTH